MILSEVKKKVTEGESLHMISQVFTEIASAKLKRIRKGIEQNRYFFYDLTQIYSLVNMLAVKNNIHKKAKNPRTAVILVCSNYRFYGQVTNNLIEYFLKQTAGQDVDRFIVGKTAHTYLDGVHYQNPYKKLVFRTDIPERDELQNLTAQIKDHAQVLVFYSQMKSVLVQLSVTKDITQSVNTGDFSQQKNQLKNLLQDLDYIMEPDLKIMLQFFDTQIKSLLVEQTFLESELARTASRLITMDNAQNQAKDFLKQMQNDLRTAKKNLTNARILEAISALSQIRSKA